MPRLRRSIPQQGAGAQVSTHFYHVLMEIEGIPGSFRVYAGFPTGCPISEMNVGFLGYLGFFDRFTVNLDGRRRVSNPSTPNFGNLTPGSLHLVNCELPPGLRRSSVLR